MFDICGSVDAKIIYFKQRKKYQIDLTVIWQLNWPIWQWSDNWIDQFDDADHIAIKGWNLDSDPTQYSRLHIFEMVQFGLGVLE